MSTGDGESAQEEIPMDTEPDRHDPVPLRPFIFEPQNDNNSRSPVIFEYVEPIEERPPQNSPDIDEHSSHSTETIRNEQDRIEVICDSPEKKRRSISDDEDEGTLCVICFDHWTNSGEHHLTSLKCGHLFGHRCILRWLTSQSKKSCPTCKTKASVNDLRSIYAKKIVTLDTSELNRLQEELENTKVEKNRLYSEVTRLSCVSKLQQDKIDELNRKIDELKSKTKIVPDKPQPNGIEITYVKSIEICKDGGSRTMCHNNDNLLVVASKSPNSLFSGFGIRKIDASNFTLSQFVPLHSQVIRDLAFHPQTEELLLSVSMDKTAKVTNMNTNNVMAVFTTDMPLWSCTWDHDNPNMIFIGGQRGYVIQYDINNPCEKLRTLTIPDDMSPVVALASVGSSPGNAVPQGGLLCCKLTSCWMFRRHNSGFDEKKLPIDGPFVSLCYDKPTRQVLASARPNQQNVNCRHVLFHIENGVDSSLVCNTVHCFQGGTAQTMLSRTRQISLKHEMLVAAYQETRNCLNIWSVSTGRLMCRTGMDEPVMDMCHIPDDTNGHLVVLSEKKIKIYKFK